MGADLGLIEFENIARSVNVLLIDDNASFTNGLAELLNQCGFVARMANSAHEGLVILQRSAPDVVVLGSDLADCDKLSFVKRISQHANCGIIVLSGQDEKMDCVIDLELGADDFIIEAMSTREILARIRAVARRVGVLRTVSTVASEQNYYQIGRLLINSQRRTVRVDNDKNVSLSDAEFVALHTLVKEKGKGVSRERLSELCFRRSDQIYTRSVDRLIARLRQKLAAIDNAIVISSNKRDGYSIVLKAPNARYQFRTNAI